MTEKTDNEPWWKPDIFDYLSYREFMKDFYTKAKRAYARDVLPKAVQAVGFLITQFLQARDGKPAQPLGRSGGEGGDGTQAETR